jgi:hypothetical protein
MRRTLIFSLAFGLLLGFAKQTIAINPENYTAGMQFQEVQISLAGTSDTRTDYFAGKNPRAVIFAPGAMFSKESWHFLAKRFQELKISSNADVYNLIHELVRPQNIQSA